jgi:hypothetical protein
LKTRISKEKKEDFSILDGLKQILSFVVKTFFRKKISVKICVICEKPILLQKFYP